MSARKTGRRPTTSTAKKRSPAKAARPAKKVARAKAAAPKKSPKKANAKATAPKKAKAKATAPKKAKAKAKAPTKRPKMAKPGEKKPPITRRDGSGHLDPRYAAELRERSSEPSRDDNRAFLKDARSSDGLAEELGEEVVEKMTSGEDEGEEVLNQRVPEEEGGPFVETTAGTEFGYAPDASNPKGSKREPFPTT